MDLSLIWLVWMWHVCVLCIPGAIVVCIRRGQHYLWYPLLLTYVTDTEPLRSEMNTLLLFCQASEEKKNNAMMQCISIVCTMNMRKESQNFQYRKTLMGPDDSAEHPSAIIFSFFFFFIQTIVQYLHLQIKSFLNSLYLQHFFCVSL